MRKWICIAVAAFALACGIAGIADPVATAPATTAAAEAGGIQVGSLIWTFINSPVGVSVVGAILAFILGKVFTAKPAWKKYVDKYRPVILAAIKKAEKAIDDDTSNKGLKRLDMALEYVLKVNEKLDRTEAVKAITAVHAEAEKDGNL